MSAFYDLTWLYLTWQPCVAMHMTKLMSQHPGLHFLIINSLLCKDGNDNFEQLVHCGEFGCIKTAQVRRWISWWHHFSSDLGSHVCAEQLFQCGERICLCRGIWRILLGALHQYPEQWPLLWLPLSLNNHHASTRGNDQWNLEYYVWPCLTSRGTWWWSHFGQCL